MRLHMSRERLSVPSQWAVEGGFMREPRTVSSYPYGASRSANTAITSIATTMSPPSAPSGFRRANRPRARRLCAPTIWRSRAIAAFGPATPSGTPTVLTRLVPDPRVEDRVERVDAEVDQDDDRDDDEVDALDDRIVALVDRVEQEAAHP